MKNSCFGGYFCPTLDIFILFKECSKRAIQNPCFLVKWGRGALTLVKRWFNQNDLLVKFSRATFWMPSKVCHEIHFNNNHLLTKVNTPFFQPCRLIPWSWNMPIIIPCSPKHIKNIHWLFKDSGGHLNFWVELCMWHYSHETLFISILFTRIIIHSNTIIENIDITHNILIIHTTTFIIHTGINFFLFPTSLPMTVR